MLSLDPFAPDPIFIGSSCWPMFGVSSIIEFYNKNDNLEHVKLFIFRTPKSTIISKPNKYV